MFVMLPDTTQYFNRNYAMVQIFLVFKQLHFIQRWLLFDGLQKVCASVQYKPMGVVYRTLPFY